MEILVFKTNIQVREDIQKVGNILMKEKDILAWNVDTGDCDKVLRIEAKNDITRKVEFLVTNAGFHCSELR
jgi:hypothetical protein